MVKRIFHIVLIAAYVFLTLWGFLSGMLSEGLIGSTHPAASVLADTMVWLGLVISLSAVVCPLIAFRLKERSVLRGFVLALPFVLFAVQMVLAAIADKL